MWNIFQDILNKVAIHRMNHISLWPRESPLFSFCLCSCPSHQRGRCSGPLFMFMLWDYELWLLIIFRYSRTLHSYIWQTKTSMWSKIPIIHYEICHLLWKSNRKYRNPKCGFSKFFIIAFRKVLPGAPKCRRLPQVVGWLGAQGCNRPP